MGSAVDFGKMETTTTSSIVTDTSSTDLDPPQNTNGTDTSEHMSVFDILDSAFMSCRDGLCWSEGNDASISVDMSSFDQVLNPCSPSMSMSNSVLENEKVYSSRWQGHLPLAPMPSTDSCSPNKSPSRKRTVR
mmetsp:Transcript_20071/g.23988  ORF Transcript_20071/g.23988 Transcript_20071/m.23988 type:complete len:133 (+) Transcript_20071:472-870(+)